MAHFLPPCARGACVRRALKCAGASSSTSERHCFQTATLLDATSRAATSTPPPLHKQPSTPQPSTPQPCGTGSKLMAPWTQVYAPIGGSVLLSALVASLPVVVLLGLLAFAHVRAHLAALIGLATCMAVACVVYGMPL